MITLSNLTEQNYTFESLEEALHFHTDNAEGIIGLSEQSRKTLSNNLLHLLHTINPKNWRASQVRDAINYNYE